MLALEPTTRKHLIRIVHGMTESVSLQEDLLQEALIHFWKVERERPGQTMSWYLQSCAFHVRHCLAAGRSVDSSKRRALLTQWPDEESDGNHPAWPAADHCVASQVAARDIMGLLSDHLDRRDQIVLLCLAEGQGVREIARRLKVSHPVAIKSRRKIAALALRFGFAPDSAVQQKPGAGAARTTAITIRFVSTPTRTGSGAAPPAHPPPLGRQTARASPALLSSPRLRAVLA